MRIRSITTLPVETTIDCDVCIVGSGPAGVTLAHELDGTTAKVVLLESGGRTRSAFADALNSLDNVGEARTVDQWEVRNRILGGTSHTWSGRLATFDEIDFSTREWVPGSGWPIPRFELARYFARALPYFGGHQLNLADNNGQAVRRRLEAEWPGVDRALFRPYGWRYSRDALGTDQATRFGPRAQVTDLSDVECLLDATVCQIDIDPVSGRVSQVEIASSGAARRWVRARFVVLCTGAIENARLLLVSDRVARTGLGNRYDMVGRYLMDHLRGQVGVYRPDDHLAAQRLFKDVHFGAGPRAATFVSGVALTANAQRSEKLLNAALFVHTGEISVDDPVRALKELGKLRAPSKNARRVLDDRRVVFDDLLDRLRSRPPRGIRKRTEIGLQCMTEQQPDPDRRVRLSDRVDAFGTRLPAIDWRITEMERRTVRFAARTFADQMSRLGHPVPHLDAMIIDDDLPLPLPDVAHPTGTTRMASRPTDGVVDRDCQVFGVAGLYVAGSSVFPTSGHANPTQLIVALAVRLADHLKVQLRPGSVRPEPAETDV